ncbi:MAG: T9SS type A sorting domain-containing protein [Bacteroidetes bacterium]|nr:T9SS type A sorting domain-containing protein [Bacteroidota bacterium]
MKRITLTPFLTAAFFVLFCLSAKAQHTPYQEQKGASVSEVRLLGKTIPLSEVAEKSVSTNNSKRKKAKAFYSTEMPNFEANQPMPTPFADVANPKMGDPIRQLGTDKFLTEIEPDLVLEGMDEADSGVSPPDPNGDVSTEHYIQLINSGSGAIMSIWDKETGEQLLDALSLNSLWEQFNITGLGDGVVLYDQAADRWVLTELGTFGTNAMLVAISETNDPFGSYFAYEFSAPNLPDYPKYGIWHNAYMITTNEPGETEIPVYLLDREAMLNGEATADMQRLLALPKFNADNPSTFQVATPADWDGDTPPPANSPQYVIRIYDDAWEGGSDALEVWEILVDWDNPNNSAINGPLVLQTEAFDSELCNSSIFDCITQFGENGTLSALQQVIMNRIQYRNFGSHESIVLNHSVDVDGNNTGGVRWYELRKMSGGDWEIYQQGTVSPDDDGRFMGSIAMDGSGNILLGYSVTSANKPLSLRFTGRYAGDPPGEMTIDEFEFAPGEDEYFGFRWGDYANTCVDPDDDATFWFTGEYMKEDIWGTKIMRTVLRRDSNDIGSFALITPQDSEFLTATEEVKVSIRNFGLLPAENFSISYQFENGPVITDMISDTLIAPDSIYEHTFDEQVDMSVIGSYDFTVFTSMAIDTNQFNDTLRAIRMKQTRFDAGISDIEGLDIPLCVQDFEGSLVLYNYGQETLTSVDIKYSINGGTETTINWTGSLAYTESEVIPISSAEPLMLDNTITAYTENPNGMTDEDPANDSFDRDFTYYSDGVDLRFELQTDNFPGETSWELTNSTGDVVYSGDNYSDAATLYIEYWCLPNGCYTFTIFDSFGDGISWGGVEGYYQIIRESDEVTLAIINNPSFGFEEVNDFCTDFECMLSANYTVTNESAAGNNDGSILCEANSGDGNYQYSIDGGVTFQDFALFNGLPAGEYDVVIIDGVGCSTETTLTITACAIELSANVTDASNDNSEDGVITVGATNGLSPYQYSLDGNTYQDENIFDNLPEGDYTIYVIDANGCEQQLMVSIGSVVSNQETFFGYQLEVFPNPTPNLLTINLKGMQGVSTMMLSIFDASGRKVKTARLVAWDHVLTGQVSMKSLANGTYFIRFDHPDFNRMIQVQKFE